MLNLFSLWGPVVAHMALIFAASSVPDVPGLPGEFADKIIHFLVYALLGLLIIRALAGGLYRRATWRHAAAAVLLAVVYGVSDEWHQSRVPGRTPDTKDVAADAVGATAGVAAFASLTLLRKVYFDDSADRDSPV